MSGPAEIPSSRAEIDGIVYARSAGAAPFMAAYLPPQKTIGELPRPIRRSPGIVLTTLSGRPDLPAAIRFRLLNDETALRRRNCVALFPDPQIPGISSYDLSTAPIERLRDNIRKITRNELPLRSDIDLYRFAMTLLDLGNTACGGRLETIYGRFTPYFAAIKAAMEAAAQDATNPAPIFR